MEERDPVPSTPSLPRRSPTCLDKLQAVAVGEQRMASILNRLDLDSLSPSCLNGHPQSEGDLPAPRGILQAHVGGGTSNMTPNRQPATHTYGLPSPPLGYYPHPSQKSYHHAISDSGLGSSIISAAYHAQSKSIYLLRPPSTCIF
jgi:hypothetical protein